MDEGSILTPNDPFSDLMDDRAYFFSLSRALDENRNYRACIYIEKSERVHKRKEKKITSFVYDFSN